MDKCIKEWFGRAALPRAVIAVSRARRRSRLRATIAGQVWVEDLGSTNGTRLGGEKIRRARLERGAEVVLHGDTYDEAQAEARRLEQQRGLTFIHPFDDPEVILAGLRRLLHRRHDVLLLRGAGLREGQWAIG